MDRDEPVRFYRVPDPPVRRRGRIGSVSVAVLFVALAVGCVLVVWRLPLGPYVSLGNGHGVHVGDVVAIVAAVSIGVLAWRVLRLLDTVR